MTDLSNTVFPAPKSLGGRPPKTPARKARPKAVNRERRKSEFARTYHSRERVRFVKSLGCVYCTAVSPFFGIQTVGKCHNAHTENGGRGRKGDYTSIIPLCPTHHRMYDQHEKMFAVKVVRDGLKATAEEVQKRWEASLKSQPRTR